MIRSLHALQGWFTTARPIGIDCGSEMIRFAQISGEEPGLTLRAAAAIEVPTAVIGDESRRLPFFTEAIRAAFKRSPFVGCNAVLSLPSWLVFTKSITLPLSAQANVDGAVRAALNANGIDPHRMLLRHWTAGTTAAGHLQVVVFWADHSAADQYIAAATAAGLRVRGVHVEASALIDCFSHVHRRVKDAGAVSLMVDVGAAETRLAIARDAHLLDAERIGIGGSAFDAAIHRENCGHDLADARMLRFKLATDRSTGPRDVRDVSPATLAVEVAPDAEMVRVAVACETVASRLAHAINEARQAHDTRFPGQRVTRLIFVGGAAAQPWLGRLIAERLHLPGQIGDPILRLSRTAALDAACGIDRRRPQPMWSIATGLSFASPRVMVGHAMGAAA